MFFTHDYANSSSLSLAVGTAPHKAAGLRARQRLRTPDAIQLATAIRTGATLVVTNDDVWRGLPFIDTAILGDMIEKA